MKTRNGSVRTLIFLLLLNVLALPSLGQGKSSAVGTSDSTVSVICEQGLFFVIIGSNIYGAVSFAPNKGSCAFVFTGKKSGKGQYAIKCADYDDNQLKQNKLVFNIAGRLQLGAEEVKVILSKDPDRCGAAFGVSFREGMEFDVLEMKKGYIKNIAVVKEDFTCVLNKGRRKVYANTVLAITSQTGDRVSFVFHDDTEDKDIKSTVEKAKLLCIME